MTTPTPIPMRERLRMDYGWTARQKQVLELIARGRSNTEIAEELGLSLAGAKWHVSEILSKLQADQREEAADYWRRYNGLAPRFERIFRGIAGGVTTKWVAGSAAVLVVGAATAVIVAIAINQSSDEPLANDQEVPGPVPTSAPAPNPGSGAGGKLTDLQVAADRPLPAGAVVYYYGGNVSQEGPQQDLRRAYSDSTGKLHVERLYENIEGEGTPYWTAIDPATGRVAVALCLEGYCGGYGSGEPGSKNRLVTSADGGITWADRGELPLYSTLWGFIDEGLVVQTFEATPGEDAPGRIWVFDTGRVLKQHTGWDHASILFKDGSVGTRREDGSLMDESGTVLRAAPKIPGTAHSAGAFIFEPTNSTLWGSFNYQAQPGEPQGWAVEADADGNVLRGVTTQDTTVGAIGRLSSDLVFANGQYPGAFVGRASILDLSTGTVWRIADLIGDGDRDAYGVAATTGQFAVVNAGGDCLNVRESASTSSASLACYVDGVLLRDLGETMEAGGASWLKVATPDGREGWASAEFLER
ncbi:MAG: LuxR C-terminal-related transcriptional regulator [Dehalococcoidia bacterium]